MEGEQEVCDQLYFYFSAANLEKTRRRKKTWRRKTGNTHEAYFYFLLIWYTLRIFL